MLNGTHLIFVYGTLKVGGPNYNIYLGPNCAGKAIYRYKAVTETR